MTFRDPEPPPPLRRVIRWLKEDPARATTAAVASLRTLCDVATWQQMRIAQLEDAVAKAGASCPARCFACQSTEVLIEHRNGQERHACEACGYCWRLGMRRA